jgi:hypothetical protein
LKPEPLAATQGEEIVTHKIRERMRAVCRLLLRAMAWTCVPGFALAQSSPFMTGMTSLQAKGRTPLTASMRLRERFPKAQLGAFALVRTLGLVPDIPQIVEPCTGAITWTGNDARRDP